MNHVVLGLNATGALYNVLNTAYAGGADPTGVADSTAAFQAAMTAATSGQPIIVPAGTYLVNSASLEPLANTAGALIGTTGTAINFDTSGPGINFAANTSYQRYVIRDITFTQTGAGDVMACGTSSGQRFPQLLCVNVNFNANNTGGACLNGNGTASSAVMADSFFLRCGFGSNSATRTIPLVNLIGSEGGGLSNITFDKCDFNPSDAEQYCALISVTTSGGDANFHAGITFRDCRFEQPLGGAVQSLSGRNLLIDNCVWWDLSLGGNPALAASVIYIGSVSNQLVSEGTRIVGCCRDLGLTTGSNAGTGVWDIELDATCAQTLIDSYTTAPGYHTSANPAYFNFHGGKSVTIINPQDATAADATSYQISNPPALTSNLIQPGILPAGWQPADSSYLAWNFDPASIGNATSPTSAQAQFLRIQVRQAVTVTNVIFFMRTPGSDLSDSYVALVNSSGTTVGVSTDQSTLWGTVATSTNVVTPLASGPFTVQPGYYYATFVATTTGGSVPTFGQWNNYNGNTANAAGSGVLTGATARWATLGTVASLAGPFTLSSNSRGQVQYWGALS